MKYKIGETLFKEEEILSRADELGAQITKDFEDSEELICLGILRGCVIWFADIVKKIDLPVKFDFIRVSSYKKATVSSDIIEIHRDTWLDVKGKDILIVEDIVDTGKTCDHVKKEFLRRGARMVKTCTLLSKPARRQVVFDPEYIGFEIPDKFVIGYGMDVADEFRNLPYIAVAEKA
jgi:hypoxanthine phosphoribosyltransferase